MYYAKDTKDVIFIGDAYKNLQTMADESIDCIVTSPPYWGKRDYENDNQIGLELMLEDYINNLVRVFTQCRRILKSTGSLWLNIGDSRSNHKDCKQVSHSMAIGGNREKAHVLEKGKSVTRNSKTLKKQGFKNKELILSSFRVAEALRIDGWYLRQVNIWNKTNALPFTGDDRTTDTHEYIFHFTKAERYFYNQDAIRDPITNANKTSVWTMSTEQYRDSHYAVMPLELADICVKAGCPKGGIVLDPFGGAGTTAIAALQNLCHYFLIELNPNYVALAQKRIKQQRLEGVQLELFDMTA